MTLDGPRTNAEISNVFMSVSWKIKHLMIQDIDDTKYTLKWLQEMENQPFDDHFRTRKGMDCHSLLS